MKRIDDVRYVFGDRTDRGDNRTRRVFCDFMPDRVGDVERRLFARFFCAAFDDRNEGIGCDKKSDAVGHACAYRQDNRFCGDQRIDRIVRACDRADAYDIKARDEIDAERFRFLDGRMRIECAEYDIRTKLFASEHDIRFEFRFHPRDVGKLPALQVELFGNAV